MTATLLYHALLKDLRRASRTRPHYLNDLRFLLSRPLVMPIAASRSRVAPSADHSTEAVRITVENYLSRPPSLCWAIDSEDIFSVCKNDLRRAMESTTAVGEGSGTEAGGRPFHPVAQQLRRLQDLKWIQQRVHRILSTKTASLLQEALDVSGAPVRSDDVIPPDFFGDEKNAEGGGGAIQAEGGVISAGAIGCQREMFIYRTKEDFPLVSVFLEGFNAVDSKKLRQKVNHHSELVDLVKGTMSTESVTRNEHLKITARVSPFDPDYTDRSQAGQGYFANAHRQFMLSFTIEPLEKSMHVLVVNSHFAQLNLAARELAEDVGYLHPEDVVAMLRESDRYHDGVRRCVDTDEAMPTSPPGEHGTPVKQPDSPEAVNVRQFDLVMVTATDGPTCLKGLLYYKIGTGESQAHEPIRVIPFGQLLLMP